MFSLSVRSRWPAAPLALAATCLALSVACSDGAHAPELADSIAGQATIVPPDTVEAELLVGPAGLDVFFARGPLSGSGVRFPMGTFDTPTPVRLSAVHIEDDQSESGVFAASTGLAIDADTPFAQPIEIHFSYLLARSPGVLAVPGLVSDAEDSLRLTAAIGRRGITQSVSTPGVYRPARLYLEYLSDATLEALVVDLAGEAVVEAVERGVQTQADALAEALESGDDPCTRIESLLPVVDATLADGLPPHPPGCSPCGFENEDLLQTLTAQLVRRLRAADTWPDLDAPAGPWMKRHALLAIIEAFNQRRLWAGFDNLSFWLDALTTPAFECDFDCMRTEAMPVYWQTVAGFHGAWVMHDFLVGRAHRHGCRR